MVERKPAEAKNLDRYGHSIIEWAPIRDQLAIELLGPETACFLGTTRPDGRPHSAGIGPVWFEGDLYFTSGPGARKARNLAANPHCTLSIRLKGYDLVLEGKAGPIYERDVMENLAKIYRDIGWPAEVEGDGFTAPFSAPSAGPPPWHLFRFTLDTAFALRTEGEEGATRWRFSPEVVR
jgi:hypothetical protein